MSVLIKNMEMPKGCIYANDNDQTEYCPLLNHDDVPFCQYIENEPEAAIGIDERPVYCPLEEYPEPCEDAVSRQAAIDALMVAVDDVGVLDAEDIETVFALLPSAKPEPRWIPCSERLPDNRVSVIACYREWQQYAKRYIYSIVIGWYARKHSVRENVFSEWEGDCDYDEDEDEFYIQEGWYEFTTQGNGDLMNWYINAEVVAWMPLPEPYRAKRRTDE